MLLKNGMKMPYIVLMAGGILITALPGLFESTLSGTASTLQPLGGKGFATNSGRWGMAGNCDVYKQEQQYGVAPLDLDLSNLQDSNGATDIDWDGYLDEGEVYGACQTVMGEYNKTGQDCAGGGGKINGSYAGANYGYGERGDSRGLRNNNPCNVKVGGYTKGTGMTGCDCVGHAVYPTPAHGFGGCRTLLTRGYNGKSMYDLIAKFAPASDGNTPGSYAERMARKLGISPNQPLNLKDNDFAYRFIKTMFVEETGGSDRSYGDNTNDYIQEGMELSSGE